MSVLADTEAAGVLVGTELDETSAPVALRLEMASLSLDTLEWPLESAVVVLPCNANKMEINQREPFRGKRQSSQR